jgi:hypothetical protein
MLLRWIMQYIILRKEELAKMCPYLSSRSKYAICSCFSDGLMVPSVFERENYCLALYGLCPLFTHNTRHDYTNIKGKDLVLIGGGVRKVR